jgi:AcrR family transcriptional regulator
VRSAVLEAAVAVLIDKGTERFSIAEVARLAGVHETSIYRRWGTMEALVVDACLRVSEAAIPIPDTGSLRADLVALLDRLVAQLVSPRGRALLATTAARGPHAFAVRRSLFRQRFDLVRAIFDRAVARGEFSRGVDPAPLIEALVAPLYFRLIVTGEPIKEWPRNQMIDRLLAGYRATR